jgi:hypothetical protein
MKFTSIEEADIIYSNCRACSIINHKQSWLILESFHKSIRQLERYLNETGFEDYWILPIRKLKMIRFRLCATPFSFDNDFICPKDTVHELRSYLLKCEMIYPGAMEYVSPVLASLNAFLENPENPMVGLVESIVSNAGDRPVSLLLKDFGAIHGMQLLLDQHGLSKNTVRVINHYQLETPQHNQMIVTLGPARWFPDHIFLSPKGTEIHVIAPRWMRDSLPKKNVFVSGTRLQRGHEPVYEDEEVVMHPEEVLPQIDWDQIWFRFAKISEARGQESDEVDASLVLLAGDSAVFLDLSQDSNVLVLDLADVEGDGSNEDSCLVRVGGSELRPGMFILLRTEGGGDYIVPVADRILGNLANSARALQRNWKTLLRVQIANRGSQAVVEELVRLGSKQAKIYNLRNWASDKNLCPQDFYDFLAIMRLLNMERDAQNLWDNAALLESAHRKAGFQIRRMLIREVLQSNLEELAASGRMDFQLPEADGGTLSALRVESISPQLYKVPISRVGIPLGVDDDGVLGQALLTS